MKDTKERMLATAFALLTERGYNGVSIGDIASALDIARSLPYRYFKSKRELFFEAFKTYFCDRYFADVDNLDNLSLREIIEIVSVRMEDIIDSLSDAVGKDVGIFAYNALYTEALKFEPRFRKYMRTQILGMRFVVENAIKSGELKPLPPEFIERVFLDIWCRADLVQEDFSNQKNLECIREDIASFYKLIAAR